MKKITFLVFIVLQILANDKIVLFKSLDKLLPNNLIEKSNDSFQKIELLLLSNSFKYDFLYLHNLDEIDSLSQYQIVILPNNSIMTQNDYQIIKKLKTNGASFIVFGQIFVSQKNNIQNVTEDLTDLETTGYITTNNTIFSTKTKFSKNIPTGISDLLVIKDSIPSYNLDFPILIAGRDLTKIILGYKDKLLYSAIDFSDLPINDNYVNSYKMVLTNFINFTLNKPVISKLFSKDDKGIVFLNLIVEDINQPIEELLDTLKRFPINFIASSNFKNYKPYIKSSISFIPILFESDTKWYDKKTLFTKYEKIWSDYTKQNQNITYSYRFFGNDVSKLDNEVIEKLKIKLLITDFNPNKQIIGKYKNYYYIGNLNKTISDYFKPGTNPDTLLGFYKQDIAVNKVLGIPYNFYLNDQINYPSFHFGIQNLTNVLKIFSKDYRFLLYPEYLNKLSEIESYSVNYAIEKKTDVIIVKNNSAKTLDNIYIDILIPKDIKKYKFNYKDSRISVENNLDNYILTIQSIQPNETIKIPFKAE